MSKPQEKLTACTANTSQQSEPERLTVYSVDTSQLRESQRLTVYSVNTSQLSEPQVKLTACTASTSQLRGFDMSARCDNTLSARCDQNHLLHPFAPFKGVKGKGRSPVFIFIGAAMPPFYFCLYISNLNSGANHDA